VPIVQKEIIRKCNRAKKFVITATQMLESMTENLIPERAEVSDVTNAILDGSNYVMLSAETAVGLYPVECVDMMKQIIKFTEGSVIYKKTKR
jgi:pyruvate kinase